MQTIQLLILAALAAVVLFSLYNVLGKRVGRQPEDVAIGPGPRRQEQVTSATVEPMDGVALSGLAALKARDPAFDVDGFLTGARSAHETIVKAFAGNDRRTLEGLTRADVFATFDNAIRERENAGVREAIDFLNPARADLESAEVEGDVVRLKVRFLSEFRSRRVAADGTVPTDDVAGAGDERRAAEAWTFERTLGGNDPTWALARVEAAEA